MYWRSRKKEIPRNNRTSPISRKSLDDNPLTKPPRKPHKLAVTSKILGIASSVLMVFGVSVMFWEGYWSWGPYPFGISIQFHSPYYPILWIALAGCLLSIILGIIAQYRIRRNPEIFSGTKTALAGIIFGITFAALLTFWLFTRHVPMLLCFLSMGLVYWILIHGTIRLKRQVRAWLVVGYAVVHVLGWGLMHLEARKEYIQREMEPYFNNIEKQLIERKITKEEASRLVKEERNRLGKSVIRTRSLSPVPGILLCEQNCGIWGETDLYLFTGRSVELVWGGMVWL